MSQASGDSYCIECNKHFKNKSGYVNHYRMVHKNLSYSCDMCDFKSSAPLGIISHKNTMHNAKDIVCEICNASFGSVNALNAHMAIHIDYGDLICGECGFKSKTPSGLKAHERVAHNEEMKKHYIETGSFYGKKAWVGEVGKKHKRSMHLHARRRWDNATDEQMIKWTKHFIKFRSANQKVKIDEQEVIVDSSFERLFFNLCMNDSNVVGIVREPICLKCIGISKRYFPDFAVLYADSNIDIVEIKSHYTAKSIEFPFKAEACANFAIDNGFGFKILTEDELHMMCDSSGLSWDEALMLNESIHDVSYKIVDSLKDLEAKRKDIGAIRSM